VYQIALLDQFIDCALPAKKGYKITLTWLKPYTSEPMTPISLSTKNFNANLDRDLPALNDGPDRGDELPASVG
jgi:hypothetical protein